jgi:hypothetical protein
MALSTLRRRRHDDHPTDRAQATITQAEYMIGIYAEILAMDLTITERVRNLLTREPNAGDRERTLANLRLLLAQLEKISRRIAYWNARLRKLVKSQLLR